ncbi:HAMP domain-containing sensor histidine kinase [Nocardioides sp.]|uniref:HAMP domain-containing sensor histidine kinase n=1 Tax=Nocardioides sp. TaxID=35761 RepID=UPI002C541474|nr:HAMP domain-containing sensor histidine kinase [Nocardioides sp.]HXH78785.1 HAMP domain-containing sensor histidine kinase [Nocardioides sp.]
MDADGGAVQVNGSGSAESQPPAQALQRLSELVRRVNSSTDTAQVLEEVVNGVHEELGYGVVAISQLEGDVLVMVAVAGPEDVRQQILGRRTPAVSILDEYRAADHWGILRYVPHGRMASDQIEYAWIPDIDASEDPEAWHPEDALYAPLYSATGKLLGNMSVDLPRGMRLPGQAERDLLEMFMVQAGLALSNAQQRERLAQQVRLGAIVKEVAQAGSRVGIDAVLGIATEAINRGFGAAQTWVRCHPDGERGREVSAGHPRPNLVSTGIETLNADLAQAAWPARRLVSIHVDDSESELVPASRVRLQQAIAAGGAAHAVVAPVGVGLELFGYLVIGFREDQPAPGSEELDTISEVSRELGRMIQSARLFETEHRLVSELRELDRYKGELIATISHELKTPLTTIIGHIELLEEGQGEHVEEGGSVAAIRRSADRLDRLIQNLLDYARVQERREFVRRDLHLVELAESAIELMTSQAKAGGVQVVLDVLRPEVVVRGDAEELGTVLNNLVSNAVKYTRPGGRVAVEIDSFEAWGRVTVKDTGIGISQIDRSHLFSAFHRSSNPEALSIPGTGLGLAISRRIAESHGGKIDVDSTLGQGSTFTLLLPRTAPEAP